MLGPALLVSITRWGAEWMHHGAPNPIRAESLDNPWPSSPMLVPADFDFELAPDGE